MTISYHRQSLQPCVLRFCGDEDGDVRVRVFPEGEEILIGRLGFGGVALHGVSPADLEIRECSDGFIEYNAAMVDDFLELGCRPSPLTRSKKNLAADKDRIEVGPEVRWSLSVGRFKKLARSSR